jgi:hypothetical protein
MITSSLVDWREKLRRYENKGAWTTRMALTRSVATAKGRRQEGMVWKVLLLGRKKEGVMVGS